MKLKSKDPLTGLIKEKGIDTFDELLLYIRRIPYGRNSNREDLSRVIIENKGTCSSKHALVKSIADENQLNDVKLILCMYKMSERNTQNIGEHLSNNNLDYIPEAHCYLLIDDEKIDLTNEHSDLTEIQDAILQEVEILPNQVIDYKVQFHKDYLKDWVNEEELNMTVDQVWQIRESCIKSLSNTSQL